MYGSHHPVARPTGQSRFLWGFSFTQIIALLFGSMLSWNLAKILPPLPVKNLFFRWIHCLTPLFMMLIFVYVRHQNTGLLLYKHFYIWVKHKLNPNKIFVWRKNLEY